MTNITMLRVLGEEKLGTLADGVVKTALTEYYNKMLSIDSSTWDAYKSFGLAYANMATVKNDDKTDRFPTKGRFYDFVGVNDSTGSLMLRAVGFNEVFRLADKSLEEMGFSPCKVDMLSRVGAYKPKDDKKGVKASYDATLFTKFMDYVATRFSDSNGNITMEFSDLATYTDASLRALIKDWEEAGKPDKYTVKKSKEETKEEIKEEPKEEIKEEIKEEPKEEIKEEPKEETKEEIKEEIKEDEAVIMHLDTTKIRREDLLHLALIYTGVDKDNVNDFIKWLKGEMLKACKDVK